MSLQKKITLRDDLGHQVLWPHRLIDTISSRAYTVPQLDISLWILDDGLDPLDVFADRARMSHLKEIGFEEHGSRILEKHLHVARQCVLHVVVMAENLASIASPDVFPDVCGIGTDAVYQPLGVVVQGNL